MTKPHPHNFCGGAYQDWLEVMLTPNCNGTCIWCVERDGYHPKRHASWEEIVAGVVKSRCKNILLLGGEPTLYKDIDKIIDRLRNGHRIFITTNASKLTRIYVQDNLNGIAGINASIHHYDLNKNADITGVRLNKQVLKDAIADLREQGSEVRFNCTCIKGHIDSKDELHKYIEFCKEMGATSVRFAELKCNEDKFVDLAIIMDYEYGLNDDPYTKGCHKECRINDFSVSFRQMCGLQTHMRDTPSDPEQPHKKKVLYYDGLLYNGWTKDRRFDMNSEEVLELLNKVKDGEMTPQDVMDIIYTEENEEEDGSGCTY